MLSGEAAAAGPAVEPDGTRGGGSATDVSTGIAGGGPGSVSRPRNPTVNLLRDGSFENRDQLLDLDNDWAVQLTGRPSGGTFTLTAHRKAGKRTTSPIPYNATAAQVQTALDGLLDVSSMKISVETHDEAWVIRFEATPHVLPRLSANGHRLTGGYRPDVRVDRLSCWSVPGRSMRVGQHGAHGRQSATLVAPHTSLKVWRGPYVPCLPGDVLSIGADTRVTVGEATWTIGLRCYTLDFKHLSAADYTTPAPDSTTWRRQTGTAPPAPATAAWAAFIVRREGDRQAGKRDHLDLDTVLVATGVYTGPMLPAIILSGDIKPDGFLISAYAGLGSDQLRARIYLDGQEIRSGSPTAPGDVASYGWGFTRAVGLTPNTDYRVQMEARNMVSQTWEQFGDLI